MKTKKPVEVHAMGAEAYFWRFVESAESTQDAEKWLKDNAKDGETYRIVTIHREVTAAIETVKKVKLS